MITLDPVRASLVILSGLSLTVAALAFSASRRRRPDPGRDELAVRLAALDERVSLLESRGAVGTAGPQTRPVPTRSTAPVRRADRSERPGATGPILITIPDLAATSSQTSTPDGTVSDLERRFAAIWEMADAGSPADEIAHSTGQPIGRVELILGLKRRRPATGGPRRP